MKNTKSKLEVSYLPIEKLKVANYSPRKWNKKQLKDLKDSIKSFDVVDPLIVNNHKDRKNIVIGGHMRLKAIKELGHKEVPVVYVNLDKEKEKELNLRLNKNHGEWDFDLLSEFDETLLSSIGFDSVELDDIFLDEDVPEKFDIEKALEKIGIEEIEIQEGDVYQLGKHRLMCGSSCNRDDMLKLMNDKQANACITDPPYRLKIYSRNNKAQEDDSKKGYFGSMGNRAYIGTNDLPEDFTAQWMTNVKEIAHKDFHILVYEMWRNLREIWNCIEEQSWNVKNMIVWHTPNRTQGFSAKYRFFSKHDIAMVGGSEDAPINMEEEEELLQNEYETALYAIQGCPHWEPYKKGKKYLPTDFISHVVSDEKSSGQSVVFGTKPIEILIPYIKIMTKRDDIVLEPFGGSGSTLIASNKLKRTCYIMEKQPIYAQVIIKRWENLTGDKAVKLNK